MEPAQQLDARAAPHERHPLVKIAQLVESDDLATLGLAIGSHYTEELTRVFKETQGYLTVLWRHEVR